MRPRAERWVAGALALSFFAIGCTQARKSPPEIAWNRTYDAALTDAQAKSRPILLDFYTDW